MGADHLYFCCFVTYTFKLAFIFVFMLNNNLGSLLLSLFPSEMLTFQTSVPTPRRSLYTTVTLRGKGVMVVSSCIMQHIVEPNMQFVAAIL